MLTYRCLRLELLLEGAGSLNLSPDMPKVSIDKALALGCVPIRRRPGGPRDLKCLSCLSTRTPRVRRLSYPQSPVAERQESGRCSSEQEGPDGCWHQATSADGQQEPESKGPEQGDKEPDDDDQGVPRVLATVLGDVQGEFSSRQDAQEQACPYERGDLATIEGLSGEIAGQTVQGHGYQS